MLILSRKLREQIQIGEGITITVVRIDSEKVRIGIDAPRDVPIAHPDAIKKRTARGD